ncbi:hypothetical protein KIN20_000609 [Parelaphostrongylus tenuis]|uniref:WAP domain-containing protein n=1 Tax=Parelaphostrongylus tenuis TaxID=148309 RepID=A0AAD5LV15_PARTN|nr:hypothetical protein KIN20_000609 [Parelaphostrongylus tenuis]
MLLSAFIFIATNAIVSTFTCYRAWLGHNPDAADLDKYRYYVNEIPCTGNESVCALFVWRTTGHTNFTIASADCVPIYEDCKNTGRECCISTLCAGRQLRIFNKLVDRYNASIWS